MTSPRTCTSAIRGREGPDRPRRALAVVVLAGALAVVAVAAPAAAPVGADPGDIGWEGPSFDGASGSPSGSKPQSKVWFNDGQWWATLYDSTSGDFHIWRLDVATQTWADTGTLVDTRPNSRSDALWTGQHLYIANHVFSESSNSSGAPAELRRYSYDATLERYTADAGFPVAINDVRSETLVIDREPTGRLWATWVQGGVVKVAHTTVDDRTWAAPFTLPVAGASATSDDISSVVAFRNDRIGILWSNQAEETMSFATHLNSADPGTWSAREIAYSGPSAADDHINLATVQDVGGRVLAAVKTSRTGSGVLNHLLDRDPTTGVWTSHPFGLATENHTRPIVVVDSEHQVVHMYATSGQSGGSIYEKTAPLADIDFAPGRGTPVLTDASSADINNAATTKQNVTSATGLVVLASNDSTRQYWTHHDPLDGPGPPGPVTPVASFTRSPATGVAPLDVGFTDTSTNTPTSWAWDFGDGGSSGAQHPVHRYEAPGTYTVTLTATNAAGGDAETQVGSVVVTDAPPSGTTVTVAAAADGLVKSTSPTKSYGTTDQLQVRAGDPSYESYLRFDVAGLAGTPTAARLRLWVDDASNDGGTATRVGTAWTETSLTWNSRPAPIGGTLGSAGPTAAGQWVEIDVTAAVAGNGAVAFRVATGSTNSGMYSSREGAHPPQLVVTSGGPPPGPTAPVASFTRTPAAGPAPLGVSFTDTSTGTPTSWAWTFGDGGTSTARHPVHSYAAPGTYTVSLTATNATGSDDETQVGSVVVTAPPPPSGTLLPTADGHVQSGSVAKAYGAATTLKVRAPAPAYESYLQFTVSGLSSAPASARLRLWVTDASPVGGVVTRVDTAWTESSLTWGTRPVALGAAVATIGATTAGTWIEVDVTAAVTGNGAVGLRLTTTSTNSAIYSSREGAHPPVLVITP